MALCKTSVFDSGLNAETFSHLIKNSGRFYRNADLSKLDDPNEPNPVQAALENAQLLGITSGGTSFGFEPEYNETEFDGKRGKTVGGTEMLSAVPSLSTTIKEINRRNLGLAFPSVQTTAIGNGYTRLTMDKCITYHDNFVWVGTHGDRDKPIIFVVKNAMNVESVNIQFQDKAQAGLSLKFEGSYTEDGEIPAAIYMADESIFTGLIDGTLSLTKTTGSPSTADAVWTPAAVNGFDKPIALTIDAPTGITLAATPVVASASNGVYAPQTLTINAVETMPAGDYTVTVLANVASENIQQTYPITVTIPA